MSSACPWQQHHPPPALSFVALSLAPLLIPDWAAVAHNFMGSCSRCPNQIHCQNLCTFQFPPPPSIPAPLLLLLLVFYATFSCCSRLAAVVVVAICIPPKGARTDSKGAARAVGALNKFVRPTHTPQSPVSSHHHHHRNSRSHSDSRSACPSSSPGLLFRSPLLLI